MGFPARPWPVQAVGSGAGYHGSCGLTNPGVLLPFSINNAGAWGCGALPKKITSLSSLPSSDSAEPVFKIFLHAVIGHCPNKRARLSHSPGAASDWSSAPMGAMQRTGGDSSSKPCLSPRRWRPQQHPVVPPATAPHTPAPGQSPKLCCSHVDGPGSAQLGSLGPFPAHVPFPWLEAVGRIRARGQTPAGSTGTAS